MKMKFKQIQGPHGIPVYLEYIPGVCSVSMSWTMFVGSADDESIGVPGLYHWFEHIPFRGTVQYPEGYKATKGFVSLCGGSVGAYTSLHATTYHAHVPKSCWRETLSLLTDLMSRPLLVEEDIYAEREVILQEIAKKKSSLRTLVSYKLPEIIWTGHPFGHPILGSEQTLASMSSHTLRKAHEANYDRNRCALVVSGNISEGELLKELQTSVLFMPDRGLSPRKTALGRGPLPPWQGGAITRTQTNHSSAVVLMLFPVPANETLQQKFTRSVVEHMFDFGNLAAPLYRVLREERKLVYATEIIACDVPGGGYWGFLAETRSGNIDAVVTALKDLLVDPEVVSSQRLDAVKRGLRGSFDIRPIDPAKHREYAVQRLVNTGSVYTDDEYLAHLESVTIDEVKRMIQAMRPEKSHTIIFWAII